MILHNSVRALCVDMVDQFQNIFRCDVEQIGETDPTTRQMLIGIMTMEEEHADDMRDLLH